MRLSKLLFFLTLTFGQLAVAIGLVCPTIGAIRYNSTSKVIEVCETTNFWGDILGGGALPATCTVVEEGKQRYDGGIMQFCNGTDWVSLKSCATTTDACATPGRQRFSWQTNRLLYCDGAKWNIMHGGCAATLACTDHIDAPSCGAGVNCLWNGTSCQIGGCSGYTTQPTCDADINCSWSLGTCNDAI